MILGLLVLMALGCSPFALILFVILQSQADNARAIREAIPQPCEDCGKMLPVGSDPQCSACADEEAWAIQAKIKTDNFAAFLEEQLNKNKLPSMTHGYEWDSDEDPPDDYRGIPIA